MKEKLHPHQVEMLKEADYSNLERRVIGTTNVKKLAMLAGLALSTGITELPFGGHTTYHRRARHQPRMVTSPQAEIDAWNARVEEKRALKKRGY